MSRPSDDRPGARLLAWFDEAQHALEHAPTLTVDTIRALVAQPDGPQRAREGVTWWLEEARRVLRDDVGDPMPADAREHGAWARRREARAARVDSLLAAHAESLMRASTRAGDDDAQPDAGDPATARPTRTRPSRAERSLQARRASPVPDAPGQRSTATSEAA